MAGQDTSLAFCFPEQEGMECEGNGSIYRGVLAGTKGSTIKVVFRWQDWNSGEGDTIHSQTEVLNGDMTNYAWYDFDANTGGGGKGPVTGDVQDDQQGGAKPGHDQQGEMPGEMPETGAGGLAPGVTIPVGNAAAALTMLVGASYVVLRRR